MEIFETEMMDLPGVGVVKVVSAHALHKYLQTSQPIGLWLHQQLKPSYLVESKDYFRITTRQPGALYQVTYFTEDTGWKVCMTSPTARGKEVRQHFIDVDNDLTKREPDRAGWFWTFLRTGTLPPSAESEANFVNHFIDGPFASSLTVAEEFEVDHDVVVATIEKHFTKWVPDLDSDPEEEPSEEDIKSFTKVTYFGPNGEARVAYNMSKNGFEWLPIYLKSRKAEEYCQLHRAKELERAMRAERYTQLQAELKELHALMVSKGELKL